MRRGGQAETRERCDCNISIDPTWRDRPTLYFQTDMHVKSEAKGGA